MPIRYNQSIHMNNHLLCAVAIEVIQGELTEICVMPLKSNFQPLRDVMPFNMMIRPRNPHSLKTEGGKKRERLLQIAEYGTDYFDAGDKLIDWFERLKMLPNKSLAPLAYDWPSSLLLIKEWLGPYNTDYVFNYRYRDILPIAMFLNDYADWRINNCPFAKHDIAYIMSCAGHTRAKPHAPMTDCVGIAETYRKMMSDSIVTVLSETEPEESEQ